MNEKQLNTEDPIKRFVEKETEMDEMSPMNPPDAFAPSTVDHIDYKDMTPFLQELIDEHKLFMTILDNFESALINWKKNGYHFHDEINKKFNELFSYLDKNTPGHNKKEEKLLFPLLHKRLLHTGEHSTADEPRTAVDIMEDEHIKVAQLGALCLNFLGLGSRLEDKQSREIVFELAYDQGKTIVETMRLHIYREDETLFPLAMELISEEEFEEMDTS